MLKVARDLNKSADKDETAENKEILIVCNLLKYSDLILMVQWALFHKNSFYIIITTYA